MFVQRNFSISSLFFTFFFAGTDAGLYRGIAPLHSSAARWQLVGWPQNGVNGLLFDPDDPNRLYVHIAFERVYSTENALNDKIQNSASLRTGATTTERKSLRVGVHMIRPDADVLARAAELGVNAVVLLFPWREIEPTQDYFLWQMADEAVAGATYYGLELIVRLDQPPEWALIETAKAGEPPVDIDAPFD